MPSANLLTPVLGYSHQKTPYDLAYVTQRTPSPTQKKSHPKTHVFLSDLNFLKFFTHTQNLLEFEKNSIFFFYLFFFCCFCCFLVEQCTFYPNDPSFYSLNVKRVKRLLFNRVKSVRNILTEWKSLSKRVKIIPKWVKNHSKKSENHSNRVNFISGGSAQRDSSKQKSCPSVSFPKKWNSLYWSDFHSFWSDFHSIGMIFTRFKSNFH